MDGSSVADYQFIKAEGADLESRKYEFLVTIL
jgi:hypothetical protein